MASRSRLQVCAQQQAIEQGVGFELAEGPARQREATVSRFPQNHGRKAAPLMGCGSAANHLVAAEGIKVFGERIDLARREPARVERTYQGTDARPDH